MMTRGLLKAIEDMQQCLASDGQLLASFVADRDEAAFAALVHRHGRMVFGVCRRVLCHTQDAEDAFQATFLLLARKAGLVQKRESVASWLYHVAYRTALVAQRNRLRRRARERQVDKMPHPVVAPRELQDWRPLLDGQLSSLPEKYREAIVLCDLEGRSRRDAANILGLPEGTLSSRLAAARRMLARKLTRHGLTLSGGALATALAAEASAAVPNSLVLSTIRAALLVAAGQLAAVSASAILLMKEGLKAMLLKKLILVAVAGLAAVLFGASSFTYLAADPGGQGQAQASGKPTSELEALRREVELLRLNLLVVLEKVRSQEAELAALKGAASDKAKINRGTLGQGLANPLGGIPGQGLVSPFGGSMGQGQDLGLPHGGTMGQGLGLPLGGSMGPALGLPLGGPMGQKRKETTDPAKDIEAVLKTLREVRDPEAKRRLLKALLEAAAKEMHEPSPGAGGKGAPAKPKGSDIDKQLQRP